MVTIIQGFRQKSPIADGIRNAAEALFGDRLTPALKRSQLNLNQQKFAQSDAELRSRIDFAGGFGDEQSAGILGDLSSANIAGAIRSRAAADALAGGATGGGVFTDPAVIASQAGAGQSFGSTAPGVDVNNVAALNRTRTSANIGAGATVQSAQIRAAQQAAAAEASLAENARQFGQEPVEVLIDGQPVLRPQSEAFEPGVLRDQSFTDARGAAFRESFDDPSNLTPEQAASVGLVESQDQLKARLVQERFSTMSPVEQNAFLGSAPSVDQIQAVVDQSVIQRGAFDPGAVSPEAATEAFGFSDPTPTKAPVLLRFQSRDGTQFFTSADGGITDDVTGQRIPQDAIRVGAVNPTTIGDAGGVNLTTTNETNIIERAIQLNAFVGTADLAIEVALANPEAFGFEGFVQRGVKNLERFSGAVNALFGSQEGLDQRVQAIRAAIVSDPKTDEATKLAFLDSLSGNLDAPKQMHAVLAYMAAAAIAEQTGRGLSDIDRKVFAEDVLKDPNSLFTDQKRFIDSIKLAKAIVMRRIEQNQAIRAGGDPAGGATGAITIDLDGNIIQ